MFLYQIEAGYQLFCVKTQATIVAISANAENDEARRSLVFELTSWSAITGKEEADQDDCVGNVVESALTLATTVDFLEFSRSFLFP